VVLKPVLTAMARATASSSLSSCGRLARMILVPQNRKCLAISGAMDEAAKLSSRRDLSLVGTFDTGTDSPTTIRIYPYYVTAGSLTSEHAFVHNAIAGEKNAIARELGKSWICYFVDISWNQFA
jgi:hypothetical protein